jgi:hypothetical protein
MVLFMSRLGSEVVDWCARACCMHGARPVHGARAAGLISIAAKHRTKPFARSNGHELILQYETAKYVVDYFSGALKDP